MPIAMTENQRALADSVRSWAARAKPVEASRALESDADRWRGPWPEFAALGVLASALPEAAGGGGGSVGDLAVALEQAADALVPGPVLPTALVGLVLAEHAGDPEILSRLAAGELTAGIATAGSDVRAESAASGGVLLRGTARPVLGTGILLLAARTSAGEDVWCVVDPDAAGVKLLDLPAGDFSRTVGEAHLDGAAASVLAGLTTQRVHDLMATLAAAEAAGVAAWCLRTAVEYAKVREQFGHPIGSFQAIKHLCAEMLCRAEVAAAVAWDAAACVTHPTQHPMAAAVAASVALDAAVDNAKDCIQVLGGIGFTWEHDAHLYLRRAIALRHVVGGAAPWRRRVAELTLAGERRVLHVELGADVDRAGVRAQAEAIAAISDDDARRRALADSGYLMPHWPRPYGLDAAPQLQLLIDEELHRAGVARPDLVIAGWAVPTILRHGSPGQIGRFVGPTLHGEITWCQLFSEPGAGSDLAALRTRAERVDGGWQLTGQKVWTSLADRADWGICLARTDPEAPKHRGITYFLVDMRGAGLDIRPLREITGDPAFNEVFLDAVFVPDDLVVGEINGGWPLARTTLTHERVAMGGGSSIGDAVERLVHQAAELGRTDDAALLERLGALIGEGLAGSLLDQRTTLRRIEGHDDGAGASVRKLIGVRHRQSVAEAALDLLGPDGLIAGEALENFLLTRCLTIAGGTSQVLLTLAAERILGLPRS
ncbi:MAG: 3-oxochol-4-en-24-oyl-CoA dehydrogenase [Pseudonocardiales bacterium]|nr:3-oxochol-4-en-24-oyl-CoA dehydrogenase [Pseudonocardiales bacterium]